MLKYRERVKQQYPEEHFCGVFLTADGYDGEDPAWVSVGYDTIFSQLQAMLQDSAAALATDVRMAIKHYSQLIRKYIVTDKELIEACRSIYAKHRAALDLIIEHGQVSLMREAAQRFLKITPELQPVPGGNSMRATMVGATWQGIPSFQVADTARWGTTCPLQLLFELEHKKSMLNFIVVVGPVKSDMEFDRPGLVLKLRKELKAPEKAITLTFTRIKRYSRRVLNVEDIDSIVQSMRELWATDFGGPNKLQSVENIVRNIAG